MHNTTLISFLTLVWMLSSTALVLAGLWHMRKLTKDITDFLNRAESKIAEKE